MTSKWVVCPRCGGDGYVSKIGEFTMADIDEQYADDWEARDQFVEEYTRRGGAYDEVCPYCGGERVVPRIHAEEEEPDEPDECAPSASN